MAHGGGWNLDRVYCLLTIQSGHSGFGLKMRLYLAMDARKQATRLVDLKTVAENKCLIVRISGYGA